ncbi:MAG: hypothetical protein ABIP06_10260, partial [Pyrinomonadaceae bacterium]
MRKLLFTFLIGLFFSFNATAQTVDAKLELEKLVATEQSFARAAAEKGTRAAFLEFLADSAVIFQPNAVNGKEFWRARSESPSLLSWQPTFADISSN